MDNPWLEIQAQGDELLLKMDRSAVERHNATAQPQHRFVLEMVPEPFMGRPGAPVVVLTGNPRYRPEDIPVHQDSAVRERLVSSLHAEGMSFPLVWLHPELSHTTGAAWYLAKLRPLIEATSLEQVANGVVFYESLPYHSAELKQVKMGLPSQAFTNQLAAEALNVAEVVIWQRAPWHQILGRDLAADPAVVRVRSPQSSHLSAKNLGGIENFTRVVEAISR